MARGDVAKVYVGDMLKKSFGEDFVGYIDKKYYVWANDGGEKVQIAISLTCPKTSIEGGGSMPSASVRAHTTEISKEEQEDILNLMKKLGL